MEQRAATLLARRLGPLEVVDSALWFARDNAASFLCTAAAGGLTFALGLAAFFNRMSAFPARDGAKNHLPELAAWAAGLSALFLARGLGHWAAVDLLSASLRGERKSPESCWLAAFRNPAAALFLTGVPGMVQWAGLLLVWPGVMMINRWGLALPAAVFENLPPARALRRSKDLTDRSYSGLAVWGFLLLAWIFLVANALIGAAVLPDILRSLFGVSLPQLELALSPRNPLFVVAAVGATWALVDALRVVAFALLYLNSRIEKEGGDLNARLEVLRAGRKVGAVAEEAHV